LDPENINKDPYNMKHLENYILREALGNVYINEQELADVYDEEEDTSSDSKGVIDTATDIAGKAADIAGKVFSAEDAEKVGKSIWNSFPGGAKSAIKGGVTIYVGLAVLKRLAPALITGLIRKGPAGWGLLSNLVRIAAKATYKPAYQAVVAKQILQSLGGKLAQGQLKAYLKSVGLANLAKMGTAVSAGLLAAPLLAEFGSYLGNNMAAEDLIGSNAIGSPEFFKSVYGSDWQSRVNYNEMITMVEKWGQKKGNIGVRGVEKWRDVESFDTFIDQVLKDPELWKRVHARETEIQEKTGGRADTVMSSVKNALAVPLGPEGSLMAAIRGEPVMTSAEKEIIDKLSNAGSETGESGKFSVSKRRLRAVSDVILEESREMAEDKDSDFGALDKWDGVSPSSNDEEIFKEHFLPSVSVLYMRWLHKQILNTIPATQENLNSAVSQIEKMGEVKPDPELKKALETAVASVTPVPGSVYDEPEEEELEPEEVEDKEVGEDPLIKAKSDQQLKSLEDVGIDLEAVQNILVKLKVMYGTYTPGEYDGKTMSAIGDLQKKLNKHFGSDIVVNAVYDEKTHDTIFDNKARVIELVRSGEF
jgi:hypothetical protein